MEEKLLKQRNNQLVKLNSMDNLKFKNCLKLNKTSTRSSSVCMQKELLNEFSSLVSTPCILPPVAKKNNFHEKKIETDNLLTLSSSVSKVKDFFEYSENLTKSWPLATTKTSNPLPTIQAQKQQEHAIHLRKEIENFNRARHFRSKNLACQRQCSKDVEINKRSKPSNQVCDAPHEEVTVEALARLKFTGTCKGRNCAGCKLNSKNNAENLKNTDKYDIHSNDTSHDSVKAHYDDNEPNDPELDGGGVMEKCWKWVKDINDEKIENPEKMFLPHLLIP